MLPSDLGQMGKPGTVLFLSEARMLVISQSIMVTWILQNLQQQYLRGQCAAWSVPASSAMPTQTCVGCGGRGVTLSNGQPLCVCQRIRLLATVALAPEFSFVLRLHCTAG